MTNLGHWPEQSRALHTRKQARAERDASYYALTTPERYHQHVTTYLRALDKNGDGVVSRSEQSAKKNDSSDVKVAIVGTTAPSLWGEVPTDTWKD